MRCVHLVDLNPAMCEAFTEMFGHSHDNCSYESAFQMNIEDIIKDNLIEDAVICSAGNSFGIMGGGFDKALNNVIPNLEKQVRQKIDKDYAGLLPIGSSVTVKHKGITIIYTPTMMVPQKLPHAGNVYWAMRAALLAFEKQKNAIMLLVTGFGGSCGGLNPRQVVRAMHKARQAIRISHEVMSYTGMQSFHAILRKVVS